MEQDGPAPTSESCGARSVLLLVLLRGVPAGEQAQRDSALEASLHLSVCLLNVCRAYAAHFTLQCLPMVWSMHVICILLLCILSMHCSYYF